MCTSRGADRKKEKTDIYCLTNTIWAARNTGQAGLIESILLHDKGTVTKILKSFTVTFRFPERSSTYPPPSKLI